MSHSVVSMSDTTSAPSDTPTPVSLGMLFWMFLRIGCVSFGGFMALISVIANTVVTQRKLLRQEDMLDCISLANLLPGPQGVNCVAYVGYRLRGGFGAFVSAVGVLLPTVVLMVSLTGLYLTYAGNASTLSAVFAGFTPAVAAIIVSVVHRMSQNVLKGRTEILLTLAAAVALLAAPKPLRLYVTCGIISGFGLLGWYLFTSAQTATSQRPAALPWMRMTGTLLLLGALVLVFLAHPPLDPRGFSQIALTFSGLSLMLFGGGYVFIPMIQDVVVTNYGWLTSQQFLDGIAFSQVTPGPILVIATFIAQKVITEQYGMWYGILGAVVGTLGIFTPPALLMVTASRALDYLKTTPGIQAAMRGIRCGVLGMIAVAALVILQASLPPWPGGELTPALWSYVVPLGNTLCIFSGALVALLKFQIDVVWIMPIAGALGAVLL